MKLSLGLFQVSKEHLIFLKAACSKTSIVSILFYFFTDYHN